MIQYIVVLTGILAPYMGQNAVSFIFRFKIRVDEWFYYGVKYK
jgi:hypothetical protein